MLMMQLQFTQNTGNTYYLYSMKGAGPSACVDGAGGWGQGQVDDDKEVKRARLWTGGWV